MENNRVDYIRQDLRDLRDDMQAGFQRVEDKIDRKFTDHEKRIRGLESRWSWAAGAVAVIAAIVSYVVSAIRG